MKRICLILALLMLVGCAAYNPPSVEQAEISKISAAPRLKSGQEVKVLSWNVQYMGSKNYVFWYDMPESDGPDLRATPEDITATFESVVEVIKRENPDVILIQEIDDNAKRTDYENQLERLMAMLPDEYRYYSEAWYWKARYIPIKEIQGRVGMKLMTISKYEINQSTRHQLALREVSALRQMFDLKRALLETRLPVEGGEDFIVMNTHLSAFAQGEDTMQRQVDQLKRLMDVYTETNHPWIIGGDFNLLPPGKAYSLLPDHQQYYYQEDTELKRLMDAYPSVPSLENVNGDELEQWFTHYPNDPRVAGPDRTIDYIFYSRDMQVKAARVMQEEPIVSDHLPVITTFVLP